MKQKPILRLPIARLGKWYGHKHGEVEFTQDDFNHLVKNFKENVRGYEPYLRYGHNTRGAGVFAGEPALGFLKDMFQEGDVLWGDFEPTKDEVVEEVRNGEYRYVSAEVIRNAKDKHTGERLKIFLKGHTLTNEPFIPNLPRNSVVETQYLSEEGAESEFCFIQLSEYFHDMTCTNCGAEGETNAMGWCPGCAEAAETALKPMAKPELTTLQAILKTVKNLFNRVESIPHEVMAMSQHAYSEPPAEEPKAEEQEEDASAPAPAEESPSAQEETPTEPEQPAEEAAAQDPEESSEPEQETDEMTQEDNGQAPVDLTAVMAELEALKAAKEEAERQAQEIKAELEAKLNAEREAAEEAARVLAENKEREFAQMLSDRVNALTQRGVPPVMAERAKSLIESLRSLIADEQTFVLSEGEEPIDIVEGVFSLLSESNGRVDFEQYGSQPQAANTSDNRWAARIAKARQRFQEGQN